MPTTIERTALVAAPGSISPQQPPPYDAPPESSEEYTTAGGKKAEKKKVGWRRWPEGILEILPFANEFAELVAKILGRKLNPLIEVFGNILATSGVVAESIKISAESDNKDVVPSIANLIAGLICGLVIPNIIIKEGNQSPIPGVKIEGFNITKKVRRLTGGGGKFQNLLNGLTVLSVIVIMDGALKFLRESLTKVFRLLENAFRSLWEFLGFGKKQVQRDRVYPTGGSLTWSHT